MSGRERKQKRVSGRAEEDGERVSERRRKNTALARTGFDRGENQREEREFKRERERIREREGAESNPSNHVLFKSNGSFDTKTNSSCTMAAQVDGSLSLHPHATHFSPSLSLSSLSLSHSVLSLSLSFANLPKRSIHDQLFDTHLKQSVAALRTGHDTPQDERVGANERERERGRERETPVHAQNYVFILGLINNLTLSVSDFSPDSLS